MTPNKKRRKYARHGIEVGVPFVANHKEQIVEEIVEESVEEIVEEVVDELTIDNVREVAEELGFKVNETVNYVAIKKGNRNVATMDNELKTVTVKGGEAIEVSTKEELRSVISND